MPTKICKAGLLATIKDYPGSIFNFLGEHCVFYSKKYDVFKSEVNVERVVLYHVLEDGTLCVPHGFLDDLLNYLKDLNISYSFNPGSFKVLVPDWDLVKSVYDFRANQENVLKLIDERVASNSGGVIVAPPAFGKSYIISMLASLYKDAKIDIVTKRRDVVMNIYETLLKFHPDAGIITGGKHMPGRVTVYTAASLKHSNFDADILLIDEIHELVTESYYKVFFDYKTSRVFGFTATPDTRFDGLHTRIKGLCGPQLFSVNYSNIVTSGNVVPIVVYWFKPKCPIINLPKPIHLRKRIGIWTNTYRNACIAEVAKEFYNGGLQVLVLVDVIEHALNLKKLLPEFELCYAGSRKEGAGYEKITSRKREELRKKFLNRELMGVIATGVWSTGVSFDGLEVLIRADGLSSKTASVQYPGRVSRICPGTNKQVGIVIDFLDTFSPSLYASARNRMLMYKNNGWEQYGPDGKQLTLLERGKYKKYLL